MPGKTKKAKFSKRGKMSKKSYRRKRVGTNLVGKTLNPISQRTIVKMKYAESVDLNVGSSFAYQFNLNSVFDPNRSGIGHQPYGHDQLATLYNRYRVIACSYNCYFTSSGTTTTQLTAVPANEVQIFSSAAEARENPRARFAIQVPNARPPVLSGKVYLPSLVGRTKAQYMADDRYQAATGSNPLELAILNLQSASISDVQTAITVMIVLEYTVEWFDVKTLTQS